MLAVLCAVSPAFLALAIAFSTAEPPLLSTMLSAEILALDIIFPAASFVMNELISLFTTPPLLVNAVEKSPANSVVNTAPADDFSLPFESNPPAAILQLLLFCLTVVIVEA